MVVRIWFLARYPLHAPAFLKELNNGLRKKNKKWIGIVSLDFVQVVPSVFTLDQRLA